MRLVVVPARRERRLRQAVLLLGLASWMAYTRFYWTISAVHLTLPPCPFLTLTGHPCPLCGGTRSFASVWRGDLGRAVALYPLGPLLFAGTVAAMLVLALGLLCRRDLEVRISPTAARVVALMLALPVAVSWALKLTVLPN